MAKIEKYQSNLYKFISQIKEMTESLSVECSNIDKPRFESIQQGGDKTYSLCFRVLGNRENILRLIKMRDLGLTKIKSKNLQIV